MDGDAGLTWIQVDCGRDRDVQEGPRRGVPPRGGWMTGLHSTAHTTVCMTSTRKRIQRCRKQLHWRPVPIVLVSILGVGAGTLRCSKQDSYTALVAPHLE
eukprot:scaffold6_cov330-Pavlova_lutheri.AAC.16